jgi:hypothetical protein
MTTLLTRRAAARTFLGTIAGAGLLLFGQEYGRARDLVAHVQEDLQRAADFTRNKDKERDRYHDVQHHLSEFDRELRAGKFDKGKLDDAINNLKDVVKENTLESHDRDALTQDLSDLRTLRDVR